MKILKGMAAPFTVEPGTIQIVTSKSPKAGAKLAAKRGASDQDKVEYSRALVTDMRSIGDFIIMKRTSRRKSA
jgi:hypothetical protein